MSAARFVLDVLPAEAAAASAAKTAKAKAARPPLRCEQRGGDVIYVPSAWSHAVLNTRTSVGYAVEWDSALWSHY